MASGPPPKDPDKLLRRNKPEPLKELAGGPVPAPPMPDGDWLPQVVTWWDVWAESPQAREFTTTDWRRLVTLMPLVQQYWLKPVAPLMAEIRQNESMLGATAIDRKRLGWKLTADEAPEQSKRTSSRSRKDPRREHLKAV